MIEKRILVPQRLRRPPTTGWSWLDRRFLREHGDHLSREAMQLGKAPQSKEVPRFLYFGVRRFAAALFSLFHRHGKLAPLQGSLKFLDADTANRQAMEAS